VLMRWIAKFSTKTPSRRDTMLGVRRCCDSYL
jgi:hypothetical protein